MPPCSHPVYTSQELLFSPLRVQKENVSQSLPGGKGQKLSAAVSTEHVGGSLSRISAQDGCTPVGLEPSS